MGDGNKGTSDGLGDGPHGDGATATGPGSGSGSGLYELQTVGTCGVGLDFIVTRVECIAAAKAVGLPDDIRLETHHESLFNPHGCYYKKSASRLLFNSDIGGTPVGNKNNDDTDRVSICVINHTNVVGRAGRQGFDKLALRVRQSTGKPCADTSTVQRRRRPHCAPPHSIARTHSSGVTAVRATGGIGQCVLTGLRPGVDWFGADGQCDFKVFVNGRIIAKSWYEPDQSRPNWNVGYFYVAECFDPPPAAGVAVRIRVDEYNLDSEEGWLDTTVTIPTDQISGTVIGEDIPVDFIWEAACEGGRPANCVRSVQNFDEYEPSPFPERCFYNKQDPELCGQHTGNCELRELLCPDDGMWSCPVEGLCPGTTHMRPPC